MPRRPPQCAGLCHGPHGAEVRTILLDTVVHLAPPLRRAPPGSPRLNLDLTMKLAWAWGEDHPRAAGHDHDCRGWNVHMVGATQTPDGPLDSLREVQLRELFRQLFHRCGGRLVEWSSDRLISFPGAGTEVAPAGWVKKRQVIVPLRAGVLFDGDSATLRPTARRDLDKVTGILTHTYPTATVEVAGYAATVPGGSADKALALSWARAQAVSQYFSSHGVSPSRLKTIGRGLQDPVASNGTEEGRQANRRVVITCTTR
ncbi:OmpA family protein [Streptomyces levis]|uniref:OmpA family protein n=1 Tax=Streptomyces levis TaxID=285566 RepID=UPI003C7A8CB7